MILRAFSHVKVQALRLPVSASCLSLLEFGGFSRPLFLHALCQGSRSCQVSRDWVVDRSCFVAIPNSVGIRATCWRGNSHTLLDDREGKFVLSV